MEGSQNGAGEDNRYVDRVEETISAPSCRHFTKSELKVTGSEVTSESVPAVESSFKETAYLNNNTGRHSNGASFTAESESSREEGQKTSLDIESNSEITSDNSIFDQLEQSIDRIETMLDDKDLSEAQKITVSSETWPKSESNTEYQHSGEFTTTSSSEGSEFFLTEADRQPLMTVDPNDILNHEEHSKDSNAFTEFLTIKQKRESFGNDIETAHLENLLQEQLNAQREKEEREQRLMDKILGTIPAYRGDWKRKNSPHEGNSASVGYSSEQTENQQHVFQKEVSSTQASQVSTDWNAAEDQISSVVTTEVQTAYQSDSANISSSSESLKVLEKAVLTQGSVMEPSSLIEIERKFVVTEESEAKLTELGATLLSEKSFHDIYYDTPKYKLTLSDFWLRQRDGQWQLKTPVADAPLGTSCTQYNEFTTEHEIVAVLSTSLCLDTGMASVSLKELVQIGLLNEFCSFTTTRKSYGLKTCSIDLDLTNFGVKVGEIEMVVVDADRIPEALEAIDDIAKQLDFQPYSEANLQLAI